MIGWLCIYMCVWNLERIFFFKNRTMVNENSEQVTLQALSHLCEWKVIMAVAAKKCVLWETAASVLPCQTPSRSKRSVIPLWEKADNFYVRLTDSTCAVGHHVWCQKTCRKPNSSSATIWGLREKKIHAQFSQKMAPEIVDYMLITLNNPCY